MELMRDEMRDAQIAQARGRVAMYRETICNLVNGTAHEGENEAGEIITELLSAIWEERRDFPGRV